MPIASVKNENLNKYLETLFKRKEDVQTHKFSVGQSNPTFKVQYGNEEFVLRKKPPGKLLRGAHQVNREYKVLSALGNVGFCVPKTIAYCSDTSVLGTEFYLMELVKGCIFYDDMHGVAPTDASKIIFSGVETLAHLHSYSPQHIGLADYGKPDGYCKRQLATWTRQYRASETEVNPFMDRLIVWLNDHLPTDVIRTPSVVHGDYTLSNIMYNLDNLKVRAVLDWELSTLGDPLADLAYYCMSVYHIPPDSDFPGAMLIKRIQKHLPREEDVVRRYCAVRGIVYPPRDYEFWLALSLFKLAAIAQGVFARFIQGNASSDNAGTFHDVVSQLAKEGLKIVEQQKQSMQVPMTLSPSTKGQEILEKVKHFLETVVEPNLHIYNEQFKSSPTRWCVVPVLEEWKEKARKQSLWNLFLPGVSGLSNVDYAHIAEQLGKHPLYSEVFNCSAPDTGNMEVLFKYGSEYQKETWLKPLMDGKIRSAFCMTEPAVASSDATNMQLSITRDGSKYVVNGTKWWSSGAGDPRCKVGIVMGRTEGGANRGRHQVHSMILVPLDMPGVVIKRQLTVFGYDDAPHGHSEISFTNVRVPLRNLILGEGRGFEIAQGRLGPGRIHHCMRSIGMAEACVEMFIKRGGERRTFGKRLLEHEVVQHQLAECRNEIDQARLLTLYAAHMIDTKGAKAARKEIAMIKVVAVRMLTRVLDKTIQVHGGAGVSQDFPLAQYYAGARSLRLADGPDEVHLSAIAKMEISQYFKKSKL